MVRLVRSYIVGRRPTRPSLSTCSMFLYSNQPDICCQAPRLTPDLQWCQVPRTYLGSHWREPLLTCVIPLIVDAICHFPHPEASDRQLTWHWPLPGDFPGPFLLGLSGSPGASGYPPSDSFPRSLLLLCARPNVVLWLMKVLSTSRVSRTYSYTPLSSHKQNITFHIHTYDMWIAPSIAPLVHPERVPPNSLRWG